MSLCKDSHYIVKLVDDFELNDLTYIITKYAEGKDLLEYCLNQPNQDQWLSEKRTRHIFLQLAEGMRDMHRLGLVHRDVKLLNVFVCSEGRYPKIKLGDFGLA